MKGSYPVFLKSSTVSVSVSLAVYPSLEFHMQIHLDMQSSTGIDVKNRDPEKLDSSILR